MREKQVKKLEVEEVHPTGLIGSSYIECMYLISPVNQDLCLDDQSNATKGWEWLLVKPMAREKYQWWFVSKLTCARPYSQLDFVWSFPSCQGFLMTTYHIGINFLILCLQCRITGVRPLNYSDHISLQPIWVFDPNGWHKPVRNPRADVSIPFLDATIESIAIVAGYFSSLLRKPVAWVAIKISVHLFA